MVVLSVTHPDIIDFISCKDTDSSFKQINYSLGVYDSFMKAVVKDRDWKLINPRTGKTTETLGAGTIFDLAAQHAWKTGDPGMIFLDRINRDNPTPHVGPIEAVNLCGEQPLLPYEACNLGSINLTRFVRIKSQELRTKNPIDLINWKRLEEVVRIAVRMLDNVISVCRYPLPRVDRVVKANRKIGLGVMGWADMLITLGVPYDSDLAVKLAEKVMKFTTETARDESVKLGRERGNFPNFIGSTWQKSGFRFLRNATCTTIAPTGSISMVAGCSSGIEPLFALSYYKQVMGGVRLPEVNPTLVDILKERFGLRAEGIIDEVIKCGSVKNIDIIPDQIKRIFVTAMDILPQRHILMQAAFQKYTDNAVSKTINLPYNATIDDIKKVFMLAWKLGCKGITLYRDKSKREQVLNVGVLKEKMDDLRQKAQIPSDSRCPECGANLHIEEGCSKCPGCGYSICSV
jgi:ribonucleoside-diphosphate reductase alpha chain